MAQNQWEYLTMTVSPGVRIAYIDSRPSSPPKDRKGIILLIHGFPQTSYQFRHVIGPLTSAGYRVLAPDYRGAGASSKPLCSPEAGFTKTVMALDLVRLLDLLGVLEEPVHVVGHDIGGMIAYALASRHPERVASLSWGECPLPGTKAYLEDRTTNAVQQFHFIFHAVPDDLAVSLVTGRESLYLGHFFRKIAHNQSAIIGDGDALAHYVREYSQPGALRCAFATYAAFEADAAENRSWVAEHGKLKKIPTLGLGGEMSLYDPAGRKDMFAEVHEMDDDVEGGEGGVEFKSVKGAGHYVAEENPEGFVEATLEFIERVTGDGLRAGL